VGAFRENVAGNFGCEGSGVDKTKCSEEKEIEVRAMRSVRYDGLYETSLEKSVIATFAPNVREE
jgi:hypothetical protein